jgi:leucyl/phenylalanyl-tRNA--protein transferase
MSIPLTPQLVLSAYERGIFPMADPDGEIEWFSPPRRAIIEPTRFHAPRSLRQIYRRRRFEVAVNRDFEAVIRASADRPEGTWISPEIVRVYTELHELGFAHSVEAWSQGELAGGLYGVALSGAFFGESMFHRVSNASKLALVFLMERMLERGMVLLDCQFTTLHLLQFGTREVTRREYLRRLSAALASPCQFE